jgi:hypothetical protein
MNAMTNENDERPGDDNLRDDESGRELGEFYAGAALTLLVPTLLYCAVIDQLWPLWVIVCNDALGVTMGFMMFKKMSDEGFPSCVPVTRIRKIPHGAGAAELKKAA